MDAFSECWLASLAVLWYSLYLLCGVALISFLADVFQH